MTAVASALCCAGSVTYALLGAGGVVALAGLAPARPYLVVGATALLAVAVWSILRRGRQCPAWTRRINQSLVAFAIVAILAAIYLPEWLS